MKREGFNVILSEREREMRELFEQRAAAAALRSFAERQAAQREARSDG